MDNAHFDDPHYLCSELVLMVCEDNDAGPRCFVGNLEEISARRAVVLIDAHMTRGAIVTIRCNGERLRGFVRHSTFERGLGMFTEVDLFMESCWTGERFAPQHQFPTDTCEDES